LNVGFKFNYHSFCCTMRLRNFYECVPRYDNRILILGTGGKSVNQPNRIETVQSSKIVQNRSPGTLNFFFSCFLIMIFKWPGMKIWNFDNCFTEDVKKNHIFPQIFRYIAIYLVPVGGQLCVFHFFFLKTKHFLFAVFFYIHTNLLNFLTV
jgi:hypothetical protein